MDLDFSPPAWIFVARRTFFLFFSLPSKGSSFSKIFKDSRQRTAGDKCQSCIAVECHLPLKRFKVPVEACSSSAACSLRLPHKLWLYTLSSSGWLGSLGKWQPQTHLPGCPRCPCWCFLSPGTTFYTGARCCGVASLNKRGGKGRHFKDFIIRQPEDIKFQMWIWYGGGSICHLCWRGQKQAKQTSEGGTGVGGGCWWSWRQSGASSAETAGAWSTAVSLRLLHPEQEGKLSQVVLLQPQKTE